MLTQIGDYLKVQSAQQICLNNTIYFMEKNTTELQSSMPNYVEFNLLKDKQYIARISLFCNEAIQKNQIILNPINKLDQNTYTLFYELRITEIRKDLDGNQTHIPVGKSKLKRKLTIQQQPQPYFDEIGKVQFFKLGKLTYLFAKMLDPLVNLYKVIKLIYSWQMPQLTLAFGLLLTLLVLFPKLSIIIISLSVYFGRSYIIKTVENSILKYDISKRVLPPQQNLQFLSEAMQLYCDVFQNVTQFLQQDDRTKIITIVQVICKGGILVSLLSIVFSLQTLLIIGIWTILLMTTTAGKRLWNVIWPQILHYNRLANKVLKSVAKSSVAKALGSDGMIRVYKEFYIYQNQRWWLGKQWVSQYYSDELKKQKLYARNEPPQGWKWINAWQVQYTSNTDIDGFEYANDLARNYYTSSSALKTIRRRKWKRVCMKASVLEQLQNNQTSQKQIEPEGQNEAKFYTPQLQKKFKSQ